MGDKSKRQRHSSIFAEIETIKKLNETGVLTSEIAAAIGCSRASVYKALKILGLSPNRKHNYQMSGIYGTEPLPECFTCSQPDCLWNASEGLCPEQRKKWR